MFHVKHSDGIIVKFVGVDVPRQGELRLRKRGCPGVRPVDRRSERNIIKKPGCIFALMQMKKHILAFSYV